MCSLGLKKTIFKKIKDISILRVIFSIGELGRPVHFYPPSPPAFTFFLFTFCFFGCVHYFCPIFYFYLFASIYERVLRNQKQDLWPFFTTVAQYCTSCVVRYTSGWARGLFIVVVVVLVASFGSDYRIEMMHAYGKLKLPLLCVNCKLWLLMFPR